MTHILKVITGNGNNPMSGSKYYDKDHPMINTDEIKEAGKSFAIFLGTDPEKDLVRIELNGKNIK